MNIVAMFPNVEQIAIEAVIGNGRYRELSNGEFYSHTGCGYCEKPGLVRLYQGYVSHKAALKGKLHEFQLCINCLLGLM